MTFPRKRRQQRGFVLITMAAAAIALIGAMGLAVDLGRVFIAKNETQAFVDAEALAAALQLNGDATGINNAITTVTAGSNAYNFNNTDKWNFNTARVANPTVEFAAVSSGPWYTSAGAIAGAGVPYSSILYARVTATVADKLYFLPVVMSNAIYNQNVQSRAVAGQIAITSFTQGLIPFSAIAQGTTVGPNFGLVVGGQYDLQWPQFNGNNAQCNNGNPKNCFVQPPCPDESKAAMLAVIGQAGTNNYNWGSQTNGYWGAQSGSTLNDYIVGTQQLTAVAVGDNLAQPGSCNTTTGCLSNGNKASSANYLDDRVNSDPSNSTNLISQYLSDPNRNGRRMVYVPILNPTSSTTTTVVGYGQFLLISSLSPPGCNGACNNTGTTSDYYEGKLINGNDGYCAIYAGSIDIGSIDPGAGSSTGASRVKLVQ
jgi:Flp pilus assembly protein TadG